MEQQFSTEDLKEFEYSQAPCLLDLCIHIHFYAIQAKAVFNEIVLMFLVRQVSMKMIYRCEIFKLLTYCLHFLCICSLGNCLQIVKNFFFEVTLFHTNS